MTFTSPYEESYPPSIYPAPAPTGATAGIPGTWTPAGAGPAASVAALQAGTPHVVVANPTTPWTSGQFVQTAVAGAPGRATWTGTGWVGGAAPLGFDPEEHTVAEVEAYIAEHPEETDAVLATEAAGKNRTTLTGRRMMSDAPVEPVEPVEPVDPDDDDTED